MLFQKLKKKIHCDCYSSVDHNVKPNMQFTPTKPTCFITVLAKQTKPQTSVCFVILGVLFCYPSGLHTDFLRSVKWNWSVCRAEQWGERLQPRHRGTFKWLKTEKKNWKRRFKKNTDESTWWNPFICVCWFWGDDRVLPNDRNCILPAFCGTTGGSCTLLGPTLTFTNECCPQ